MPDTDRAGRCVRQGFLFIIVAAILFFIDRFSHIISEYIWKEYLWGQLSSTCKRG